MRSLINCRFAECQNRFSKRARRQLIAEELSRSPRLTRTINRVRTKKLRGITAGKTEANAGTEYFMMLEITDLTKVGF